MYTLIILAIGIVIGWNLPQPPWARDIQDRILTALKSTMHKNGR